MDKLIEAGKIHREVEDRVKQIISPSVSCLEIANYIEKQIKYLTVKGGYRNQLNDGIAFPTGTSLDHIAAHWTPSFNSNVRLSYDSVCKVDFGTHIDGYIVDSAFTICFKEEYEPILEASKNAVREVIKNIGVDMKMSEIGDIAEEIVESYEYNDKPLKAIDNLYGHNILPFNIHGGKYIPSIKSTKSKNGIFDINGQKVECDDILAIEVFVSNGEGTTEISKTMQSNHFMVSNNYNFETIPIFKNKKTKKLLNLVKNNFQKLAFCPRYINNIMDNTENYSDSFNELFSKGIIASYPPLVEKDYKSKVAQFEDTIYVSELGVKKIS